jgi:uncharacterized protein YqjF (DUF2071 family)
MRKFLTARWQDLIMANYEVDPSLLTSRLPKGTEIDSHDGRCFVSLVGFMFVDTRVLGVPVPFHINFEEVNLRFYVRRETGGEIRRGVVFIKEIVPRYAIATVAHVLYGEPYVALPMRNRRSETSVKYSWDLGKNLNWLGVDVGENLGVPPCGSHAEFITEHYWGYTRRGDERTDEYKVEHPKWEIFATSNPKFQVNFSRLYGKEFAFLVNEEPYSILLAKGSEIAVYKGSKIV